MTVEPRRFVNAMTRYWKELGNQPSKELQAVWFQFAITFNDQIENNNPRVWQVLQPPTGTGKSRGAEMYCALLASLDTELCIESILNRSSHQRFHPGVLIVTRLIDDADNMATRINELGSCETARAVHSQSKMSATEMASTPVLIITHSAYVRALSEARSETKSGTRLMQLHAWMQTQRRLVIVDEAPNLIETTQLDLDRLKVVVGHIPEVISEKFPGEVSYLNTLVQWIKDLSSNGQREQVLESSNILSEQPDFASLRIAMKSCRLDRLILSKNDGDANKRLQVTITETLNSIEALAGNWCLYAQSGNKRTLNFARHVLPEDHQGAVILDATASTNLLYNLFENRVAIIPTPKGARQYNLVTLHASRGHRVGKLFLIENAIEECNKLVTGLRDTIDNSEGGVFVCCHKDVKPILAKHPGVSLGHWGAVDGQNDWRDCDTAVIFGVPYRGNTWAANSYMAVRGKQTTDWIGATGKRPFGGFADILHELEVGAISTNIIQAINRVRCRRVIDENGNCPSTDVYILLPTGKLADEILKHIESSMPGVKIVDWAYSGAKKKDRKLKHADALISHLRNVVSGRILVHDIRKELSIPKSSFEKLVPKLKDETSHIFSELMAMDITYEVEGRGRRATSYFLKPY